MSIAVLIGINLFLASQEPSAPPQVVILGDVTSPTFNGSDTLLLQEIKEFRKFKLLSDGSLGFKSDENSYVFVRSSFPPLKSLRFKQHILNLYSKYGPDNPLKYSELATPDFEAEMNNLWISAPSIIPTKDMCISFEIGLEATVNIPGFPIETMSGPRKKLDKVAQEPYARQPANILKKREEIVKRRDSLRPLPTVISCSVFPHLSWPIENTLTQSALRVWGDYLTAEIVRTDEKLESALTDRNLENLKSRRKLTSMEQLQANDNSYSQVLKGFLDEDLDYAQVSNRADIYEKFSRAKINYQYGFAFRFSDGKQMQSIRLK